MIELGLLLILVLVIVLGVVACLALILLHSERQEKLKAAERLLRAPAVPKEIKQQLLSELLENSGGKRKREEEGK